MRKVILISVIATGFFLFDAAYAWPNLSRESTIGEDLKFDLTPADYSESLDLSNKLVKPNRFDPGKKYPVLLVLHTCGGPKRTHTKQMQYWVKTATEQNYLALQIDSVSVRGHRSNCNPRPVEDGRLLKDIYDAAEALSKISFVDSNRIFTQGGSLGAMTSMLAASPSMTKEVSKSNFRFRAHIALFPGCDYGRNGLYIQQDIDRPLLVLMGAKDMDTPPANCYPHFERLKTKGAPIEWHTFPTASHNWDNPDTHGFTKTMPDGRRATYLYDAEITEESRKKVLEFLDRFK